MPKNIFIRPQARRDLIEQFVFIGNDSEDAAFRFLEKAEATFEEITAMPTMGSPQRFANPALSGMRRWRIRDFEKHLIFYRPIQNGIEIVRVLYASRDIEKLFEE